MIIFDRSKILELRTKHNLTPIEFGRKIGTSRQRVCNWETGDARPNMDGLESICNTFDVDPSYFFAKKQVSAQI